MLNFLAQRRRCSPIWVFAVLSILLVAGVRAETPAKAGDVRILIDISGSMLQTDPRNFRTPAINLLIDSLPEGSQAGIWSFGRQVNLLVRHETVTASWRDQARERVSGLRPIAQRTNLGGVLDNAAYDFGYSTYSSPTDIVLITDGQVDIAPNAGVNQVERDRILSTVIPRFAAAGARIHTLALTDAADTGLLEQMALRTQGIYAQIESAADIRSFILQVLTAVKPGNELPLDSESFAVDGQVSEVTAMILHNEGQISLRAPSGQQTSALNPGDQRWRVGDGYTLVTINTPETGRWQLTGMVEDGSRISVVSDMNLEWRLPAQSVVIRSRPLTIEVAAVDETGAPIASQLTDIMVPSLRINGETMPIMRWQDNVLKAQVPNRFAEGPLDFEIGIDAQTFQRVIRRTVQNRPALTSEVLVVDEGYQWRLYPSHSALELEGPELSARIQGPSIESTQPFERHATGYFYLDLPADSPAGEYRMEARGQLTINDRPLTDLGVAPVTLQMPVASDRPRIMSQEAAPKPVEAVPEPAEAPREAFVKEPMPEFEEISAELTVNDVSSSQTTAAPPPSMPSEQDSVPWLTYLLFSLPGVVLLVGFYLFYRALEKRGQSGGEDLLATEPVLGEAGLDDIEELDFDAGIGPSDTEDYGYEQTFEDMDDDAPVVDEVVEDEPENNDEPPTPEKTEAPRFDMEDNLDTSLLDQDDLGDWDNLPEQGDDLDVDDDLFDISNIDDSLADLDDLALDEDDTFGMDDEDEENGQRR